MEIIETLVNGVYVNRQPLDGEQYKVTIKNGLGDITHTVKATHYDEQLPNDSDLIANDGGALDE